MIANSSSIAKRLIILVLAFVLLHYGKLFLMPLAIGGILATLFLPLCKWIEGKNIYKGLAALTCLLILIIVILSILVFFGWEVSQLSKDFELIKRKAISTGDGIQEYLFSHLGISVEKQFEILKDEQPSIARIVQKLGSSLSLLLTNFIFVLAYTFLFLYYRNHIHHFIIKVAGNSKMEQTVKVISSVTIISQQYLIGLSKMIGCLWILYSIGFSIIGVKNAFFFAILCGLLEIVPFIGNITGTTLTVLVSAVNGASLPMLGGIVVTYGIIQFFQGWVLEPLIVGRQVKINPLITIMALVLGELVWGVPGIFLAIPITAMCKAVFDQVESLKPYGFLIGEIEKSGLPIVRKVKSLNKRS